MIYNQFTAGSVVWARVAGYPWWPAMVDDDPDLEQYYWLEEDMKTVTHYHVVFFDEVTVTRAWVNLKNITSYFKNENRYKTTAARGLDYKRRILVAKEQANDAVTLTTAMRLKIYSFIARYKGPITTSARDVKRTMTKYKLKINISKKKKPEVNMSPRKENRPSKKASFDTSGKKEDLNNDGKVQKNKRNQKDSIPIEEQNKCKSKKVVMKENSDDSLKRKPEEDSDIGLPIKKRPKTLFEKKIEKLIRKRKPRTDFKKVSPQNKNSTKENKKESNTTPLSKTHVITASEKRKELQKESESIDTMTSSPKSNKSTKSNIENKASPKSNKSTTSKIENKASPISNKSTTSKIENKASPKSNKSTASKIENKESQNVRTAKNNLEEALKETNMDSSLFVNTSKPEPNVTNADNPKKEPEPQPSTSGLAGSETPSGMVEVLSKHFYNQNTEDSIGSFVEPSQARAVERDELQEEKHSQSTIADFMANLSEDAVVPEASLSQLSEPFEE